MSAKLQNITKIYKTGKIEVKALRNVSLEIKDDAFISIAGPSGSGKTTLMNILGCIDDPTEGTVVINGQDVDELSSKQISNFRNMNLGFIFQTFNLIPVLTAYENVEFALILKGDNDHATRKRKVEDILERVGLKDFMRQKPTELSGGQQQRVAIARALVKDPKLVIADEPTANLDSKTASDILSIMRELNRKENVSFVFSTHDRLVMDYADRLIKLKDGKIESDTIKKKKK
jgi:putative ABC transport system ATP-binding protein